VSAPGLRSRIRRTRLGVKLAWLGAALTALVVAAIFFALSATVRSVTRRMYAEELGRNRRTLVALQRRNLEQLLLGASVVTQTPQLRAALSTFRLESPRSPALRDQRVRTVEDALREASATINKEILIVTDDRGRVVATTRADSATAGLAGADLSGMPAVRLALNPSAAADSGELAVLRRPGSDLQVAVYPIVIDGFTLGALLVGDRLNAAWVAATRAAFGGEVAVTVGTGVITSSLPGLTSGDVGALLASSHTAADSSGTAILGGQELVVAPMSLGHTQDGAAVDLWLMQPLSPAVRDLTNPLAAYFLGFGALAVLLAGLGTVLLTRSVLRPFDRFVSYMRQGAATQHLESSPFDASETSAEVRTLNESFTQLMESLATERRELEQRSTQLAAANADLREEVRERVRAERALRESEAQLRQSQKLEAIGTLAGGIAHDFNNIVTVISGYTQLALMRADKGSAAAEDLRQVVEAAEKAAKLTHQLLAFSRKQVLQPTVLDLADVVTGMAPMMRRIIGEHIALTITSDRDLARVNADRGQLEQVLLNLVVNARDAMPGGGTLTIHTGNVQDEAASEPAGRRSARALVLTVRDSGSGMDAGVRDRIFEPFFTTKEPGKGTGLGLSTVYGIVKQSGGTIAVDSAAGVGSTFTITLPIADDFIAAIDGAVEDDGAYTGSETVLLVEDDDDVRTLARRTLEERGYRVIAASNANEALEVATDAKIDVLLTDIVMPGVSGTQLVKRYRATRPGAVVVYMSGYADEALAAFEIDRDRSATFLRKPFSPLTLARTLREALSRSSDAVLSAR
jgi:signal transduction histidine kinase/ActR/RegA family two-component response regulator